MGAALLPGMGGITQPAWNAPPAGGRAQNL